MLSVEGRSEGPAATMMMDAPVAATKASACSIGVMTVAGRGSMTGT